MTSDHFYEAMEMIAKIDSVEPPKSRLNIEECGGGDNIMVRSEYSTVQALSARDKKILGTGISDDIEENNVKNDSIIPMNEWNTVDIMNLKQGINFDFTNAMSTPINFSESWSFFQYSYHSNLKNPVNNVQRRNSFQRRLLKILGRRGLKTCLVPERDLIFAVAACPMNNDCAVHRRIIQSIYFFMTKKSSCPRFGNHWEQVGFQGQDPASDLRGVGMFGAVQLLFLSCAQETKNSLAPDIYELSRRQENQFPLAVLSLNVTKMAVDAFRDGLLNKMCNKSRDCVSVVNRYYLAVLYRIYKKWKEHNLTIHDSCYLLKNVEKWCRAHPRRAFSRLGEYLAQNDGMENRNVLPKRMRLIKKTEMLKVDGTERTLSWLDLTKPSLEVFI